MEYRNITKTVYKVSDFLSFQRNKSLILSPSFQRRSVWPKAAKSYLIDSIVRSLPIPIIFIREQTNLQTLEQKREIVDGQQRLRTLISFIEPNLLQDFTPSMDDFTIKKSHNKEIGGKKFKELDQRDQKRILNYEFSVHILSSETDDREVLQIFARMNSTGVKLNRQELRNAEFFGEFKQLAYDLSYEQLNRWRNWNVFSENDIARMMEVEETSDLILIMIEGLLGKSQPALDKLYEKYEESFDYGSEVARRFRLVMDKIDDTIGLKLHSLAFSRKALFNTLFTLYYDILFGIESPLKKKKPSLLPSNILKSILEVSELITLSRLPEDLVKVLRGATGNKQSREVRLKFLKEVIKNG